MENTNNTYIMTCDKAELIKTIDLARTRYIDLSDRASKNCIYDIAREFLSTTSELVIAKLQMTRPNFLLNHSFRNKIRMILKDSEKLAISLEIIIENGAAQTPAATLEIIEQRKLDSYYKKGSTPANKGLKQTDYMTAEQIEKTKATRFKKGQIPHNSIGVKDGDVRIRIDSKGNKYNWIRVSLGHWVMLHRYNWELLYGKLKKGQIVRFKDGNTMNCDPSNLMLIDMKTNMELNTIHRYPDELKRLIRLKSKLFKTIQYNDNITKK